jgi:putative aldouronate transport system substrate-binding protein
MQAYNSVTKAYGEVELWKRYEKRTNVHIDWISVTDEERNEKRNLSIASGDLPDAYYRCAFSNADLLNYGMDGLFINLMPLIPEYAPYFKVMMDADRAISKGITQADGKIYSLPFLCDFLSANFGTKIFYNQKWLDSVKRPEPATADEILSLFRLYKQVNPGGREKCIPLECNDIGGVVTYFHGIFGLQNRGSNTRWVDMDPKTNTLRFFLGADEYRSEMEFINLLYREQLLNPDIFTNNLNLAGANMQNQFVGAYIAVNPVAAGQFAVDYIGGGVLEGPTGVKLANGINPKMRDPGALTITKVNKYPELTMKWADYFYSEEGVLEYYMGWEGETFTIENGVYTYVPFITNNPSGLTLDQAVSQFVPWPGAGQPTLQTEKYSKGGASMPQAVDATRKCNDYFPKEIWAQFTHTAEESERLIPLITDLTTCINEARANFITSGVTDASWNKYLSDLRSIGLEEFMKIQQDAYNRYIR